MDNRALHLQPAAHAAVARALSAGRLIRQPCEVCGGRGQAHHDSYYPERWLDVRWLCPSHHRQWHVENEPEWPDIFDFHPSDGESRKNPGRKGRLAHPWWNSRRKLWYVTLGGRQHNLGPEQAAALTRFEALLRDHHARQDAAAAARQTAR